MANVLYLPQPETQPIFLKGKKGFVPAMPFRLLFKVENFNTLLVRRGNETRRVTYIDVGHGEDRERYFCEFRPIAGMQCDEGDVLLTGLIRNEASKPDQTFRCEGLLNTKTKDGYIFC